MGTRAAADAGGVRNGSVKRRKWLQKWGGGGRGNKQAIARALV
jgi:hypothetical protein